MSSSVAVIAGSHSSFLDHLIPLTDLLNIPIYAPGLPDIPYPNVKRVDSLQKADTLLYVEPYRLHEEAFLFGNELLQKKCRSICGLHGNSNKSRNAFWAERFVDEDLVLLYGSYMEQFFQEKRVPLKERIFCGNYRWHYFEKYRDHFALQLPGDGKKILYAPTWSFADATDSSPFFNSCHRLLDDVPEGYTVIVKLHPYTFLLQPKKVEELQLRYSENERIFFLPQTPWVYPILEQIDLYIGDFSSVAYDFLKFDRPLFFMADSVDPKLLPCGHKIEEGNIFSQLENEGSSDARQQLYNDCFADIPPKELRCRLTS